MITPLVRIPCILVAMVGLQMAMTPPHTPPSAEEKAPSTNLEIILKQRAGPSLVRTICWSAALAEAAVVLASSYPDREISGKILTTFVSGGNAERIRPTGLFFLGVLLTSLGGYIRWLCYRSLGRLFTFEMSIRKNHQLITDGPYAVVRHPGYTGVLLTVAGIICWHASEGSWVRESGILHTVVGKGAALTYLSLVSTITFGLLSRMSKEDEALRKTFGEQWDEWARRVPYKLIPWIY